MRNRTFCRTFLLLLMTSTLIGCAGSGLYDWGSYDRSVGSLYESPDRFQIDDEIERLGEELQESEVGRIPPGKAAYLGYLYTLKGDSRSARTFFEMEQRLFPESKVLMSRLLAQGNTAQERK